MNIASMVEIKKNPNIPDITPGDTVRVSTRIVEGGKERIQVFQGVVIQMRRGGIGANFTVRHVAFGIGVERTFPFYSPLIERVEVVRHGKVRRAKLYYLRGLSGKKARRKIKRVDRKVKAIGEELVEPEPEEVLEPEAVVGEGVETEAIVEEGKESVAEEEPTVEGTQELEAAVEPEIVQEEAKTTVTEPEAIQEEVKGEEPVVEPEAVEEEPTLEKESEPVQEEEKAVAPAPEQAPVMEKKEETESVVETTEDQEPDKETP